MAKSTTKELVWIGSSLKDVRKFPDEVRQVMGYALYLSQREEKHPDAKPLKGFHGAGELEMVDDFDGNTYRTVYSVRFKEVVYVLHAFQKKSKRGISTPKKELDLVTERLKAARQHYKERSKPVKGGTK